LSVIESFFGQICIWDRNWVYGVPQEQNPILDFTGANCVVQQSEKIWFLANSDTLETVVRLCNIPPDTSLFFPIIKNIAYTPPGVEQTCEEAKEYVEFESSPNTVVTVKLNGSSIKLDDRNIFGSTECFDMFARVPSEVDFPSYYPSATGGYWLLLNPLPAGVHELDLLAEFHDASKDENRVIMQVKYQLTVQAS